ncbi:MAG: hypothetical protein LBI42_01415 [Chitinispirillales bacterium]|jgi:hypothetical protein|nr:hypothetical protein [Chitinispirillales bacterium]
MFLAKIDAVCGFTINRKGFLIPKKGGHAGSLVQCGRLRSVIRSSSGACLSSRKAIHYSFFLVLIIMFLFTGCADRMSVKRTSLPRAYTNEAGFTFELSANWTGRSGELMTVLTLNGLDKEFIQLKKHPLSTSLPHTELSIHEDMQPYETAEIVMNNLRASPGIFSLTTEKLTPAVVDGKEGFGVRISYFTENGLARRCFIYGFISGERYVEIGFYALAEHYFDAGLEDFFAVVHSFIVN